MNYLEPKRVIAKRRTKAPKNYSRSGYGNKLPTEWQLQLIDKRWRRVYIIQWSNAGTAYIKTKNGNLYLGSYDPNNLTKG